MQDQSDDDNYRERKKPVIIIPETKESRKRKRKEKGFKVVEPNDKNLNTIGFKTKSKIKALHYNPKLRKSDMLEELTNYFPLKRNIKLYQLHKVAPRHSYQMDLMIMKAQPKEDGVELNLAYLVLVNVNTKFLIAELVNIIRKSKTFAEENMLKKKSTYAVEHKNSALIVERLKDIVNEGIVIRHLTSDNDVSLVNKLTQDFCKKHNINYEPVDKEKLYLKTNRQHDFMKMQNKENTDKEIYHPALATIDRAIRTIRDMAYVMGIEVITPEVMRMILYQYNNAPHKTLSKYAHRAVTPMQVQNNPDIENLIVRNIIQENYNIINQPSFNLPKNLPVRIYNPKGIYDKRRMWIQPGNYRIVDRFDNLLYIVRDENNLIEQIVPRWKIALT